MERRDGSGSGNGRDKGHRGQYYHQQGSANSASSLYYSQQSGARSGPPPNSQSSREDKGGGGGSNSRFIQSKKTLTKELSSSSSVQRSRGGSTFHTSGEKNKPGASGPSILRKGGGGGPFPLRSTPQSSPSSSSQTLPSSKSQQPPTAFLASTRSLNEEHLSRAPSNPHLQGPAALSQTLQGSHIGHGRDISSHHNLLSNPNPSTKVNKKLAADEKRKNRKKNLAKQRELYRAHVIKRFMSANTGNKSLTVWQVKEFLLDKLLISGQHDLLKRLIQIRMAHTGWTYALRSRCIEYIKKKGVENVNISHMISDMLPIGLGSFQSDVRSEISQFLTEFAKDHLILNDSLKIVSEKSSNYSSGIQFQSRDTKPEHTYTLPPPPPPPSSSSSSTKLPSSTFTPTTAREQLPAPPQPLFIPSTSSSSSHREHREHREPRTKERERDHIRSSSSHRDRERDRGEKSISSSRPKVIEEEIRHKKDRIHPALSPRAFLSGDKRKEAEEDEEEEELMDV